MKRYLLLISLLLAASSDALAACHAVGPSSAGTANGSSWTNRMAMPGTGAFVRGDVYYLMDGSYPAIDFNQSGTAAVEIRKAQSYDFGRTADGCSNDISAGWVPATMGSSQAIFSSLFFGHMFFFESPGFVINGNGQQTTPGCGGAVGNDPTVGPASPKDCGIKIDNSTAGTTDLISNINNSTWTAKYLEIRGNGNATNEHYVMRADGGTGGVVNHVYLHYFGAVAVVAGGTTNIQISNNYFFRAQAVLGTNPGHGQGIEIGGSSSGGSVFNNVWRDMSGTAAIATFLSTGTSTGWKFYDNLVWNTQGYTPWFMANGVVACINSHTCNNLTFMQNVVASIPITSTQACGSPPCFPIVGILTETGGSFTIQNNLWYNNAAMPSLPATENHNSYLSTGTCPGPTGTADVCNNSSANPFNNWPGGDFTLATDNTNWNNRVALGSPYDTDLAGNTFTTDRGAYQFTTGPPANPFSQTNTCGTSLAPGASCTFSVTFKPTVLGAQSSTITITDNASNSPQSIPLSGTGTGTPSPQLSPPNLNYSPQLVGTSSSSQPAFLTNNGTAPLTINSITTSGDYSQTNNCVSPLAVSASCTINVTFSPTAPGTRSGSLAISSNGPGSPNTAALTGSGIQGAIALAPTSLTFTALNVGSISAGQAIAISNPGTATVNITSVALTGTNTADFGLTNGCGATIAAGASCNATITFSPSATGSRTASLSVVDNAPGSPHQAPLSGTGTAPVVSLTPTSIPFGNQINGTISSAQNLTLANSGTGSLTISSIALTGANASQFTQSGTCGATLGAGASCTIAIRFAPTSTGAKSASLTVTDSASGSPHSSTLSGTGIAGAPVVSLTPSSLTFPSTLLGVTSAGQTATLQNTGTATLNISAIATSGDYSQTNTCGATLVVSASCVITVRFTPTVAGTRTGTLSVTDDAAGSPHTVSLTGTGLQALATPSPASVAFGNAVVGFPTTPTTVTLSNGGTATLQGITVSLAGTDPGDYIMDNTLPNKCNASLAAGGSCQVTVAFSPTTTGSRPATLRFADSAANTPQDVPLSGTGTAAAPAVTFTPSSLDLGSQQVGNTSAAQSIALKNTGTATLNIASIVASGDFANTTTCGATLAFGATCTISVTFTPTTTGTRTGAITVTSDAATSPDAVSLTGQGTPVPVPVATLTPSSLTYGSQQTGTASAGQDATLKNTGSANLTFTSITLTGANPGDYSQTSTCVSPIVPAASCTITVRFTPTLAGTRTATLSISDNASGTPHTVSLSGTAFVGSPGISFNPTSVTFANQAVQVPSAPSPVQLTNTGTAALLISNIATTGDYSQTNNCGGSVAVGATCIVNVVFTPLSAGVRAGTLAVTDNASGSPHSIPLSGSGSGSNAVLSPSALNFSNQIQGTTSPSQPVTLSNTGNITMTVNSIGFSSNPTDYAETDNCVPSLGAGASCTINVTFTPTAVGSRPANLVVTDTAPGSPQTVALTGTGIAGFPVVQLTPPSLDFGSIQQGSTTANQTVAVKNVGTAILNISSITKTGANAADYGLTNGCGATLAINATCTLTINFTPSGATTRVASISIADDASNTPQAVPLTGVGTAAPAPKVSLSAASLTYAAQQVGTPSGSQSVTVTNIGDAALTVSSIALGPPNATDYVLTNGCGATLAPAASCTLGVVFKPVAAGTRVSTVTLTDNAADSPQSFNLTGTAFSGTPTADLSVGTLIFLSQVILTTSASQTIALTNNGTASLLITSIVASSDSAPGSNEFVRTTNCSGTLPVGASCTVNVTFTPQAIGGRTGKVTFINSAGSSPQIVSLVGTGTNPPPPPGSAATGIGGRAGIGGKSGIGVH